MIAASLVVVVPRMKSHCPFQCRWMAGKRGKVYGALDWSRCMEAINSHQGTGVLQQPDLWLWSSISYAAWCIPWAIQIWAVPFLNREGKVGPFVILCLCMCRTTQLLGSPTSVAEQSWILLRIVLGAVRCDGVKSLLIQSKVNGFSC